MPDAADRPWLSSYPPGVPADVDVPDHPLTGLLDAAARDHPRRTALAFLGWTATYTQLREQVDRFAGSLRRLGVRRGDRVALVLPNCPQNVVAMLAALRLGAVAVQHNPLYTERELRHQLADSGAVVAVVLDLAHDRVAAVQHETDVRHVVVASVTEFLSPVQRAALRLPLPALRRRRAQVWARVPARQGVTRYADELASSPGPVAQEPVGPHDPALLQYTGGTTGPAKGAVLTHRNLVANAVQTAAWAPDAVRGRETFLAVLPLFHAYGLTLCLSTAMQLASTIVLVPRFDLDLVYAAIDRWHPTFFPGVPPMYAALTRDPRTAHHDLRSVRNCLSGAMPLPLDVVAEFERLTDGHLVEGYGMTETSPVTVGNPFGDARRYGTIGIPLPSTRARVVDLDDPSRVLGPGERGELSVHGPQVFAGYWQAPEQTAEVLGPDGWLRTGDVVEMAADGFVTVVDRLKEVVNTGGFNVYPSEVEAVVREHPAVAEVSVFGVPDRYRGEAVTAVVVPAPGQQLDADALRAHCREHLAAYKVPRTVEFRDELPRNLVGKVLRRTLREQHEQRAGSGSPAQDEG